MKNNLFIATPVPQCKLWPRHIYNASKFIQLDINPSSQTTNQLFEKVQLSLLQKQSKSIDANKKRINNQQVRVKVQLMRKSIIFITEWVLFTHLWPSSTDRLQLIFPGAFPKDQPVPGSELHQPPQ